LSFALERIGPLAAIIIIVFYLLVLYLSALPNTPENPFASIYCESLIKTVCQHLLVLVGFDTLIYRKYYDIPPILVGDHMFTTAWKLRQYFAVHPIIVVNEASLSNILNNPEAIGRVSLWGIELSPLDITYEKRPSNLRFCLILQQSG
jgi:hypothetical protein